MKPNLTHFTFFIFSITLLLAASCTVTKRVHQPGYSVQWKERYTKSEGHKTVDSQATVAKGNSSYNETIIRTEEKVQSEDKKSDNKYNRSEEKQKEEFSESIDTKSSSSDHEAYEIYNPTSNSDGVEGAKGQHAYSIPGTYEEIGEAKEEDDNSRGNYATAAMINGIISITSLIIYLILRASLTLGILSSLLFITSLITMVLSVIAVIRSRKTEPDTDQNVKRRKIGFVFSIATFSLFLIGFLLLVAAISGFSF